MSLQHTIPDNTYRDAKSNKSFAGFNYVDNIPDSFRTYDRKLNQLNKIEQGRAAFMRLLLNYAKRQGNVHIATDTRTSWGIERTRLPRLYFRADSASTASAKHDVLKLDESGARCQTGDMYALMGFYVPKGRDVDSLANDVPTTSKAAATPIPEYIKVISVTKVSGGYDVIVERNFLGTNLAAAGHASMSVTYSAGGPYSDGMFLWKALNSLAEGSDDMQIYSDTDDDDFNYCQIVGAKWGANETEQNVNRFWSPEKTFQRNGRRTLGEFYDALDVMYLLGTRHTELVGGKRKWYLGGLLDFAPQKNYIEYGDTLFNTRYMNSVLKDKFYYGSQVKIVIAGQDFYTDFGNMIDNRIILPAATTGWGVELTQFRASNGGTILVAPSDTLSLNGMADYAIMYDPATFTYGHLQNMDIKTIKHLAVNPHEMTAEIYGQVTAKRNNPDAVHVFLRKS
jgi:hypothetical protein